MSSPRFLLSILLLLSSLALFSQNLIKNGTFEDHMPIQCPECYTLYGQYPALMHEWDNGWWGCWVCDQRTKQYDQEGKNGFCPMDLVKPYDGKTMIAMWYEPAINGIHGGATHLTARTTAPMLVEREYEISFWLYIQANPAADPEWPNHIGIALVPEKMRFHNLTPTRKIPSLNIDTIIYNRWYQVKWRVRPLCNSQFLMIGVFGTPRWPASQSFRDGKYWVDNVQVTERKSETVSPDSSFYYCSKYAPADNPDFVPTMDDKQLHFETGLYALTPAHETELDTFIAFARKYPQLVFEITGHTDSIGADNQLLSENRAKAVLTYLTETGKLPAYRFLIVGRNSMQAIASNRTAGGRALNRRVEIRQSALDLPMVFYRNALAATANKQYPQAFAALNQWLKKNASAQGGTILLFDPRLEVLKKQKHWPSIEKQIRASYKTLKYPREAFFIDSLRLDIRRTSGELEMVLEQMTGQVPWLDQFPVTMPFFPEKTVREKCVAHYAAIKPVLAQTGWPREADFGGSTHAAFALLLGSRDTTELKKWLPVYQKLCETGEGTWQYYTRLYDLCQVLCGLQQQYGTQVETLYNGQVKVLPCEGDAAAVNRQRMLLGIPLLPQQVMNAMQ